MAERSLVDTVILQWRNCFRLAVSIEQDVLDGGATTTQFEPKLDPPSSSLSSSMCSCSVFFTYASFMHVRFSSVSSFDLIIYNLFIQCHIDSSVQVHFRALKVKIQTLTVWAKMFGIGF